MQKVAHNFAFLWATSSIQKIKKGLKKWFNWQNITQSSHPGFLNANENLFFLHTCLGSILCPYFRLFLMLTIKTDTNNIFIL